MLTLSRGLTFVLWCVGWFLC